MEIQIRKPTNLTIHGHRRLCLPPERVRVADEIGARLVAGGKAVPVALDFDAMTVEQLQAAVEERGLTVEGTGQGGRALKADLVTALTVDEGGQDADDELTDDEPDTEGETDTSTEGE